MGKFTRALDRAVGTDGRTPDDRNAGSAEEEKGSATSRAFVEQGVSGADERGHRPVAVSGRWDERMRRAVSEVGPVSESIRALRTRILHPADGRIPRSVLVTSATPGEGKSFVCGTLGIMLAQGIDHYALMVDCDLRRPALHRMFGLQVDRGLVNFLRDGENLAKLILPSGVETLSLLPAGSPPVNPAELLGSESMIHLVDELEGRYEDRIILLDSPPLHSASETAILAQRVDQVILVVRAGASRREHVQRVVDQIGADKVAGVVFNAHRTTVLDTRLFGDYDYHRYYEHRP